MKIKSGYVLKKVMGSYMIVSLEGDTSAMQTTNETGAFLWSLLEEGSTADEMADKMVNEFDVDLQTAKNDINAFVNLLKSGGFIED